MKHILLIIFTIVYSSILVSRNKTGIENVSDNTGMLSTNTNGIRFTIVDTSGNPVQGAKVLLYDTKQKWRVDSGAINTPVYTDLNGQVEISSLLPVEYWFNIRKGYLTNRFTVKNTAAAIDTTQVTNITITIRDLSQNEFYMCGPCDNKTWITDSMVIFGITQPYDADSKLLSDGTWFDSNGNHGFWWFNPGETTMTYDYDSSSANGGGSVVEATLIELTDSSFSGNMNMFGMPVTYYMSAQYDTISLQLSVPDTTIYLDSNGFAMITPDDLMINSGYCFTCTTSLSQSVFGISDIGNGEVAITTQDRCGNSVTDTFTVTIMEPLSVNERQTPVINLFPVPAADHVKIECTEKLIGIYLSDISGRLVLRQGLNDSHYSMNTAELKPGMYFVKIVTLQGSVVKKIIIE